MNDSARKNVSLGVMILAGVFGFVALISDRVEDSAQRRQAALVSLSESWRRTPAADQILNVQSRARALQAWIEHGNTAGDESQLYARLLALGDECGLQVQRIDPATRSIDDQHFATSIGCSIEAVGAFEAIARFIDGVESDLGFAGVAGFSLTPAEGPGEMVLAEIDTTHMRFDPRALITAAVAESEED